MDLGSTGEGFIIRMGSSIKMIFWHGHFFLSFGPFFPFLLFWDGKEERGKKMKGRETIAKGFFL